ncbi:MAG: aminotransferase class V-fold PLP-dependent enzyme [bacterium]|nr:aminotransferase class V-fold PLP-dependent enzyme [bacterium]
MKDYIYLDNGATTYPKPQEVLDYAFDLYKEKGVNPGRSGYDASVDVENMVDETRKLLMEFFNGDGHPERLVFSYNASDSLNNIIQGILKPGDHAITTNLEHNSVLRPMYVLSQDRDIDVDYVPFDDKGYIDPDDIKKKINDKTKLVVVNHGSNVLGTIQPIGEVGKICRERGIIFAIDAAQTAGMLPIDMEKDNIDIVAFTGHKSLYAPTGIGGLYVRDGINIDTTRYGGTGVKSAVKTHLPEYPFRLENGTLNIVGVAGLNAGVKYINKEGLENIHKKEMNLLRIFIDGLKNEDKVKLYCPDSLDARASVQSLNIDGFEAGDVGIFLDVDFNIGTRTGLQCAPLAHVGIGTDPKGTVRFSIGYFNTEEHITKAIDAVKEIASQKK